MVKGCIEGCAECERLDKAHLEACCFSIKFRWSFGIFADQKEERARAELENHIALHKGNQNANHN